MKRIFVIEAVGLMFWAGCAIGPNYHAPRVSLSQQWATLLEAGESNARVKLAHWWKNFNDDQLNALIMKAIDSNFTLRMAEDRVREARAQRDVAFGGLWPSVSNETAYMRNRYGQNSFPPLPPGVPLNFNEYNLGFDAAWEIDIFGGNRRAVEAANAQVGAAQYSQRDVLVSLIAEVARNYMTMRGLQERLRITQADIKIQEQILDLTISRYKNGLSNEVDVQAVKAGLDATQAQIPSLEAGFQESVFHLAVLLGENSNSLMKEMAIAKPLPLNPPEVPVGLPSDLLQRRPDVQKSLDELAAATARIGVAKAQLFPKFSLTAIAGVESLSTNNWIDNASRYWTAGPVMQWQLFEAGRIRALVRVENARQQEALDAYQQTVLTAVNEVDGALTAYAKEHIRRTSLIQSLQDNQRSVDLTNQLYLKGIVNYIRVLNTQRALLQSQVALVQSNEAVSLNLIQLYKALGGGWESIPIK